MQAVNKWATASETAHRKSRKKLKKLLKRYLTKWTECDIICFTSALQGVRENGLKTVEKNLKKF